MADGEDEPEFEVDQYRKLSESHTFALYKDLEGYHSLWDTSFVPSKTSSKKGKRLGRTVVKIQLSPCYLKRH